MGKGANPLDVAVYKMAGHDRHGAWFARRNVVEGLGFTRFKRAMQREFPHSMTVAGGPGAGAVRGLAADTRVESREVEGVGKLEAYVLSAQFPGPVTPRDFTTMVMTTEDALGEKSAAEVAGGEKHVPRHFMIVSKPVQHPDAEQRAGFVRGQYESVEMIREVPLHRLHAQEGSQTEGADGEAASDPELNPVEWIMVTRSDPGGGIPRFLVDRGTPEAMLGDLSKFLNWATSLGDIPESHEDLENVVQEPGTENSGPVADGAAEVPRTQQVSAVDSAPQMQQLPQQQQGGLFSGVTSAVSAGLEAYAPTSVSQGVNHYLHPDEKAVLEEDHTSDSSSDSSSVASFMSAEEIRRLSTAPEVQQPRHENGSSEAISIASQDSSEIAALKATDKKQLNHHEKEVLKLARDREKLDRKLAKKREDEENRLKKSQEKDQSEQDKAKEKHEKDIKKAEERHKKEVEKLERKKEKEARKAEEKRVKKSDAAKLSQVCRERDEFRTQLDSHKRENRLLLERMEELQRENTIMASRLGKVGGLEALKGVQEEVELARKRAGSTRSEESKRSLELSSSGGKAA